jgi:hypothetical protein
VFLNQKKIFFKHTRLLYTVKHKGKTNHLKSNLISCVVKTFQDLSVPGERSIFRKRDRNAGAHVAEGHQREEDEPTELVLGRGRDAAVAQGPGTNRVTKFIAHCAWKRLKFVGGVV